MIGEALKGHLDLLLLAVLERGPAHGYVIIDTLRLRSGGTFDLPEGTVYPALHRLEEDGLLSSQWFENGGRRRRIYQLTSKGRLELAKRQEDWNRFAQAVNSTVGV
jgi:PadR family transcriptional regulator, regulatory protein PadR